ncbi:hypothetical protein PRO82_001204 [Candidatus Protochlamydia amoebophila]|nr:hypothetical protein [Candidatus Protochlamydia amoebophila]
MYKDHFFYPHYYCLKEIELNLKVLEIGKFLIYKSLSILLSEKFSN